MGAQEKTSRRRAALVRAALACLLLIASRAEAVDSDRDLLSDADEALWGTSPSNPDSDGDGFLDGEEVEWGASPTDPADYPNPYGGRAVLFSSYLSAVNEAAPSDSGAERSAIGSRFSFLNDASPSSDASETTLYAPATAILNDAPPASEDGAVFSPVVSLLNRNLLEMEDTRVASWFSLRNDGRPTTAAAATAVIAPAFSLLNLTLAERGGERAFAGSVFTALNRADPQETKGSIFGQIVSMVNRVPGLSDPAGVFVVGPYVSALNRASPVFSPDAPGFAAPPFSIRNGAGSARSEVAPLPGRVAASGFLVEWSGGESALSYEVYVSADGGAFSLWRGPTTSTEAVFQGAPGATYAFYSLAVDGAGYWENAPPAADATTRVNRPPSMASASIRPSRPHGGGNLSVECAGWADLDGDAASYRFQWMKNGAAIPGATDGTLSTDFFSPGDSLSCVVTPWDGLDAGDGVEAPSVVVRAGPPALILTRLLGGESPGAEP